MIWSWHVTKNDWDDHSFEQKDGLNDQQLGDEDRLAHTKFLFSLS